jgi:enoyl-CoA hydratase/carnithine racemase
MIFTGEALPADLAVEIGLVNQCVPGDSLIAAAEDLANQILACGPTAVRCAKKAMCAADAAMLKTGLAAEAEAFGEAFASDQGREGLQAFLEKRKPNW